MTDDETVGLSLPVRTPPLPGDRGLRALLRILQAADQPAEALEEAA